MGTSSKWQKTFCTRCLIRVDKMNRLEQDQHEIDCKKQEKLI